MRGYVLIWSGDKGVVSSGGRRYDFNIDHWQSDKAPASNMTVEIAIANGQLESVAPVSQAELAKETMAELTGQGSKIAKAVFENVGKDVAIAYGVFLIVALFMSIVSTSGMVNVSISLADLLSGHPFAAFGNSSGKGTFLVLLATATIAVPYFWKHKFAPLAFGVPLLLTLKAYWPIWEQHREQQKAIEAMGEFGQIFGQMSEPMGGASPSLFDNLGLGFWVVAAVAIYLAYKGVMRYLSRS